MTTLEPIDEPRLVRQQDMVRYVMEKGAWWTLRQLANYSGASEAGASARIRDLRNKEGYTIEKRRKRPGAGLWEYRMIPKSNGPQRRLF